MCRPRHPVVDLGIARPRPCKDLLLTIQRQMIRVFGNQHCGEQAGSRDTLVNDVCGHWHLNQRFAVLAHPLSTDMALNREHARRVVQLLTDVLADAHALAAAMADGALWFVMDLGTRKPGG